MEPLNKMDHKTVNGPLASYEELLEEVRGLRSRLASLERVKAECCQVQREREEARNTATEAIRVRVAGRGFF